MVVYGLLMVLFLADCSGCSKSGSHRRSTNRRATDRPQSAQNRAPAGDTVRGTTPAAEITTDPTDSAEGDGEGPTEVKMVEHKGVYKIPAYVNGVRMDFILDTGASLISISQTEARFLYKQGTLSNQDFVRSADFMDANGNISVGSVVRLRTVRIGNRTLRNVNASVVDNDRAPLLLGQSVLAKFGKVSIDYQRGVVQFE